MDYNELMDKYKFNEKQEEQINIGLKNNIDVSVYSKPEIHYKYRF